MYGGATVHIIMDYASIIVNYVDDFFSIQYLSHIGVGQNEINTSINMLMTLNGQTE